MCKAGHAKAGPGVLARIRHFKGRVPSLTNKGSSRKDGEDEHGDNEGASVPIVALLLRLLRRDQLTEVLCWLDVKSLVTVCTVSHSMCGVAHGSYPWRLLCSDEWGLELEDSATGGQKFQDTILDKDFRKVFPLIEPMPGGFDCRSLRCEDDRRAGAGGRFLVNGPGLGMGVVMGARHGGWGHAWGQAVVGHNQNLVPSDGVAHVREETERVDENPSTALRQSRKRGESWEEKIGGFWVKRIQANEAVPPSASVIERTPRSSELALEVEFQGGVGVGNRCVRADLPLPSTVLRERLSLAARAHVARHLAATPLALLRWFLAKMASTAAGAGGPFPNAVTTNHQSFADHDHVEDAAESEADVVNGGAVGDHDELMERSEMNGESMRVIRSSSSPGWISGSRVGQGQGHGQEQSFPQPLCYPVMLDNGVVDVTPRLVSYFEVTIGQPRCRPQHTIPDCVAVGLSEARFPTKGKMPGWDSASYGYHSDDGGAFHDAGSMLFKCGPSFGAGDVVGCGLDYSVGDDSADIFFTLNGRSLGGAFHGVRGSFYPTVGVDSACPVRLNFGAEPFAYDLVGALREGGQEAAAREAVARSEIASHAFDDNKSGCDAAGGASSSSRTSSPIAKALSRPRLNSLPMPAIFRPFGSPPARRMAPMH